MNNAVAFVQRHSQDVFLLDSGVNVQYFQLIDRAQRKAFAIDYFIYKLHQGNNKPDIFVNK
jgi:hypothetical protein